MLYLAHQIPELKTEPIRIVMHIAGEWNTALLLIIGGVGLFKNTNWGFHTYLISSGMLLYTMIVSPGYYAQQRQFGFVLMFATLVIMTRVLDWSSEICQ